MSSFVPQLDHRPGHVVFVTKRTEARRAQHKEFAVHRWLKPEPASGQHTHEVPTRKNQDIPGNSTQSTHDTVSTLTDLLGRFSSRAAVEKQFPVRTLRANISRTAPFIL